MSLSPASCSAGQHPKALNDRAPLKCSGRVTPSIQVIAMKRLLVLLLGCLGSIAMADEQNTQTSQVTVEPYRYSQNLDIANIVSMTEVPDVCDVVPVQMTYDDSKGSRHIMEYLVFGTGCTN